MTPHVPAFARRTFSSGMNAYTGTTQRLPRTTGAPYGLFLRVARDRDDVGVLGRDAAACADRGPFARVATRRLRRPGLRTSTASAIRAAAAAASNRNRPIAVSPESMMPSVSGPRLRHRWPPARLVSALGSSYSTLLAGREAARAARRRSFWSSGTSSIGIAARNHHRVGDAQDLLDVLHGGLRLDLRHDRDGALAHQRTQLLHVLGRATQIERADQGFAVSRSVTAGRLRRSAGRSPLVRVSRRGHDPFANSSTCFRRLGQQDPGPHPGRSPTPDRSLTNVSRSPSPSGRNVNAVRA